MMSILIPIIVVLALLGLPLFIAMGGAGFLSFHYVVNLDSAIMFTDFYRLTTAPALVAIPLFVFTGFALAESNAPKKLVAFSQALLGWLPGGLSLVSLVSCAVFTALTGASAITIVAIGTILYTALKQEGYPDKYSLGLVTIGGGLGILFMPCLPIIIYGMISQTSVEDLFIAGLIPGVLRIVLNLFYTTFFGVKYTKKMEFSGKELATSAMGIIYEMPLPIIIIGGIFGGVFSASEAAAVASVYVLVIEVFVTKDLSLRKLGHVIRESMKMVGAIIIIIGMALGLTDFFVYQEIPMRIFEFINQHVESQIVFLLLLNLFLLIVGAMMDIFSACAVVVPIIVPIAKMYHVDPVHLGIIFLANMELGYITPPVGMSLFVSALNFKKTYGEVVRSVIPFFIIALIGVLLITYIPDISLWLLNFVSRKALIVI